MFLNKIWVPTYVICLCVKLCFWKLAYLYLQLKIIAGIYYNVPVRRRSWIVCCSEVPAMRVFTYPYIKYIFYIMCCCNIRDRCCCCSSRFYFFYRISISRYARQSVLFFIIIILRVSKTRPASIRIRRYIIIL